MPKLTVKEIQVKSILTKSRLPEADYVINPYIGCQHSCKYCYARFMKRFTHHKEPWGEFVDVKLNAAAILEKEINKAKPGLILLSSVTDPYHPLERRYKLTREILKILLKHQFPISILTKSDLALRDTDLLKQFKHCEVGFSFMSFNPRYSKDFEPLASPPERRLAAMQTLKQNKISTYAFIGPIFPHITNLSEMFPTFKKLKASYVFCENLNHKAGNWQEVFRIIKTRYPLLTKDYQSIFLEKNNYWDRVESGIKELSKQYNLKARVYFHH